MLRKQKSIKVHQGKKENIFRSMKQKGISFLETTTQSDSQQVFKLRNCYYAGKTPDKVRTFQIKSKICNS